MGNALVSKNEVKTLPNNLANYNWGVVTKKHNKVMSLKKVKDNSVTVGRAYVAAYVDYIHTLQSALSHDGVHQQ